MAYDLALADEIRTVLDGAPEVTERRMFGGLSFLVNGNLAVAVRGSEGILVRVGPDAAEELERTTAATRAVMGARVMAGWLEVRTRRPRHRAGAGRLGATRRGPRPVAAAEVERHSGYPM